MTSLNSIQMFQEYRAYVDSHETKRAAAIALGISEAHCGDIYHGRRTISVELARKLGYEKKVQYVEIPDSTRKGVL